jgi:ABC-type multidrug transport system ATPase subunit
MPNSSDPVVDVTSFAMRFGDKEVVKDLSFAVNQGEVFGFLGANGAGKTTIAVAPRADERHLADTR